MSEWKSLSRVRLCNPMDYTAHGILQARILERVASPFSRDLPNPGVETRSPALQADSLSSEPPGNLFIHSSVDRHLDSSFCLSWTVLLRTCKHCKCTCLNTWICVSSTDVLVWTAEYLFVFSSFGKCLGVGFLGHMVILSLFEESPNHFPQQLNHFVALPTLDEHSDSSTSLSALISFLLK